MALLRPTRCWRATAGRGGRSTEPREIRAIDRAGTDWILVDVRDGRFVPSITIGPIALEASRRSTKKPINAHLMIVELER
jgi:pentose-5-phosphate-3-epimerase